MSHLKVSISVFSVDQQTASFFQKDGTYITKYTASYAAKKQSSCVSVIRKSKQFLVIYFNIFFPCA